MYVCMCVSNYLRIKTVLACGPTVCGFFIRAFAQELEKEEGRNKNRQGHGDVGYAHVACSRFAGSAAAGQGARLRFRNGLFPCLPFDTEHALTHFFLENRKKSWHHGHENFEKYLDSRGAP